MPVASPANAIVFSPELRAGLKDRESSFGRRRWSPVTLRVSLDSKGVLSLFHFKAVICDGIKVFLYHKNDHCFFFAENKAFCRPPHPPVRGWGESRTQLYADPRILSRDPTPAPPQEWKQLIRIAQHADGRYVHWWRLEPITYRKR